jgi:hypothetical protein
MKAYRILHIQQALDLTDLLGGGVSANAESPLNRMYFKVIY